MLGLKGIFNLFHLQALEIKPDAPLVLFHKALLLLTSEDLDGAYSEALRVKELLPLESSVYFLLSKIRQKVCC